MKEFIKQRKYIRREAEGIPPHYHTNGLPNSSSMRFVPPSVNLPSPPTHLVVQIINILTYILLQLQVSENSLPPIHRFSCMIRTEII